MIISNTFIGLFKIHGHKSCMDCGPGCEKYRDPCRPNFDCQTFTSTKQDISLYRSCLQHAGICNDSKNQEFDMTIGTNFC